jgi:protoheme ferro-lyase
MDDGSAMEVGTALIAGLVSPKGTEYFSVDYQKVGNHEPTRRIFYNIQDALNWCLKHDYASSKLFLKIYKHHL